MIAAHPTTLDPDEAARFAAVAAEWWAPDGAYRALHRINPARLDFIVGRLADHFGRDRRAPDVLAGLRIVDLGCGGGLVAEPLARLGAEVVGLDATPESIEAASVHAGAMGLAIDYRVGTPEDLLAEGTRFDAVIALEIVEHVAEPDLFHAAVAGLVRPGGGAVLSTLNRTAKSLLLGKMAAEYVLGWVPRGTHDWRKFVRPSELAAGLRRHGLALAALKGLVLDPLNGGWRLSDDLDVNYLAFAQKRQEL